MIIPIIGIIITFVVFIAANIVAWVLLILRITPDWTIWLAAILNFFLGCVAMGAIQWLQEYIEDKRYEKAFAEEEKRQNENL